jgi:hypothetical protein
MSIKPETETREVVAPSELLACPFCGWKAQIAVWADGGIQANCLNAGDCWATVGPLYPNDETKHEVKRVKSKVIRQWNRRHANADLSGASDASAPRTGSEAELK